MKAISFALRLGHRRPARASLVLFLVLHLVTSAYGATRKIFLAGVNYPWIAYGHDFGKNQWGHDGLITGGWTYQTFIDSQGFTDTRFSKSQAHTGAGSLCITADLIGQHPNKAKGEVYIDLRNHTPPGVVVPNNLKDVSVSCWLLLPRGSVGNPSAPNGVQFFFKSEGFYSLYSPYQNIQSFQEGAWVQFTANASGPAGYMDALYDPAKIIAIGIKTRLTIHHPLRFPVRSISTTTC